MFNSITWTDFLIASIALIGAYYVISVLLLFNREIIDFFRSGFKRSAVPHPVATSTPRHSVMGEPRTDDQALIEERTAELQGEQLIVAGEDEAPEFITPAGEAKLSALKLTVEELLSEASTVIQLAIDCDSDQQETASLMNALLIRYAGIRDSSLRPTVNQAITDEVNARLPFTVTPEDVDTWWNE